MGHGLLVFSDINDRSALKRRHGAGYRINDSSGARWTDGLAQLHIQHDYVTLVGDDMSPEDVLGHVMRTRFPEGQLLADGVSRIVGPASPVDRELALRVARQQKGERDFTQLQFRMDTVDLETGEVEESSVRTMADSPVRRGAVTRWSSDSRRRFMKRFLEYHRLWSDPDRTNVFVVLTYGRRWSRSCSEHDGCTCSAHRDLSAFKKRLGRGFQGTLGCWLLEFQDRGAPHWNLMLSFPPGFVVDEEALKRELARDWVEVSGLGGSTRDHRLQRGLHLETVKDILLADGEVITGADAVGLYMAGEFGKVAQKRTPRGVQATGRWWAFFGDRELLASYRDEAVYEELAVQAVERRWIRLDELIRKDPQPVEGLDYIPIRAWVAGRHHVDWIVHGSCWIWWKICQRFGEWLPPVDALHDGGCRCLEGPSPGELQQWAREVASRKSKVAAAKRRFALDGTHAAADAQPS